MKLLIEFFISMFAVFAFTYFLILLEIQWFLVESSEDYHG